MHDMNTVSFPGLGIGEIELNPTAIPALGVEWYAIIICAAILIAVFVCERLAKRFGIKGDDVLDAVLFGIPAGVIGARLWYIVGDLDSFDSFVDMISVWNGGLAIYGGVAGAVLTGYFVCKYKKISFPNMLDLVAIGFLIGQIIGRWGNFVNVEVFGCETDLPWRMGVGIDGVVNGTFVHPLFLYESLWNLIGLIAVFVYMDSRKFKGELFLMYLAWYGLGRSWMEPLRDEAYILGEGGLFFNQILAIALVAVSLALIVMIRIKKPKRLMIPIAAKEEGSDYESQFEYAREESEEQLEEPIDETAIEELYELDGADEDDIKASEEDAEDGENN